MFRSWFHLYVTVLQNKTVAYLGGGWVGNQGGGGCRLELAWLSKLRCGVPVFLFCWVFLGLGEVAIITPWLRGRNVIWLIARLHAKPTSPHPTL